MKIKYLATFAAISLLTIGVANARSSSSATTPSTTTKVAACAGKSNPCAGKSNPCAAKKTNPCAAKKTNPCAGKSNPCAAKSAASVGGSLAQKLQGKPVVVDIYASWCSACKNIAPTLSQLRKDYAGKVNFVVLDVSDKSTTAAAEATAKELGLSKFLSENKTQTGSLTIVDPATGKILAQYRNNPDKSAYSKVLNVALSK